jgi:hypothetical protein
MPTDEENPMAFEIRKLQVMLNQPQDVGIVFQHEYFDGLGCLSNHDDPLTLRHCACVDIHDPSSPNGNSQVSFYAKDVTAQ